MRKMKLARVASLLLILVSVVTSQECTTGEARLYNNGDNDSNRGIVQVCFDGNWNTVCGRNGWNIPSAIVVCKQLGYSEFGASSIREHFRQTIFAGTTNFAFLATSCRGDERMLTDCNLRLSPGCFYTPSRSSDGHYYAGVTCQLDNCSKSEIRLVNGTSYREGRVEACVDGRWGTVCGEGWTNKDAGHVCSRLGYSSTNAMIGSYGEGTGPVYDVHCNTSNCQTISSTQCFHFQDLGVQCESYTEACEAEIKELGTRNNKITSDTLGALLGLLVVTLVAALAGWIMTCVYCHHKTNKQSKDHNHPDSTSDTALQLYDNPVYDTSVPPPHTTYSSLGPSYQNNQGAGHSYDVLNRPHPLPMISHEYSVLEGPTHTPGGGVVEGTYSLVGESDLQVPTLTTEGGQEHSELQN